MRLTLVPHPTTPSAAVDAITVEVARAAGGLTLTYVVTSAVADLAIPAHAPPDRTDNLWKHTCCEAFILPGGGDAYVEFNLSPSTRWAAYSFTSYRQGMADLDLITPPAIDFNTAQTAFGLRAAVASPPTLAAAPWRLGLSCVIEETGGALSYWALAHPSPAPDFHNAAGFTCALEP